MVTSLVSAGAPYKSNTATFMQKILNNFFHPHGSPATFISIPREPCNISSHSCRNPMYSAGFPQSPSACMFLIQKQNNNNNAVIWHGGSTLVSINVVALLSTHLVLGWVTFVGSSRIHRTLVFNQPPR